MTRSAMRGRVAAKPKESFGALYRAFLARLKAMGCVFCAECYAYMPSAHQHVVRTETVVDSALPKWICMDHLGTWKHEAKVAVDAMAKP